MNKPEWIYIFIGCLAAVVTGSSKYLYSQILLIKYYSMIQEKSTSSSRLWNRTEQSYFGIIFAKINFLNGFFIFKLNLKSYFLYAAWRINALRSHFIAFYLL